MKKFLVQIVFEWNESIMEIIPEHRKYINTLIEAQILEHYAVSMESLSLWITINATDKYEVEKLLKGTPFFSYWTYDINELMLWDGQNYRLPVVQLN